MYQQSSAILYTNLNKKSTSALKINNLNEPNSHFQSVTGEIL